MIVAGIDPGGTVGVALYETKLRRVVFAGEFASPAAAHAAICKETANIGSHAGFVAIEGVQSYGERVGRSVFDTAQQIGWFSAKFGLPFTGPHVLPNPEVRAILVRSDRSEAALNAMLRNLHGGKKESTRAAVAEVTPTFRKDGRPWRKGVAGVDAGPLHGVTGHSWSALAVAVAWAVREGLMEASV